MPKLLPFYEVEQENWWFESVPPENTEQRFDPEIEKIRQWVLRELIETYGYPQKWLWDRIKPATFSDSIPGLKLLTTEDDPFLIVAIGEIEDAEQAIRNVLFAESFTGHGIATDGTKDGTRFLRRRFDTNTCEYVGDIEVYESINYPSPTLFNSDDDTDLSLHSLSANAENVFFKAHSHIRDIDGLHADEALDELCKILYAKLYDEELGENNKSQRIHRSLYGTTEEFAATVRAVYSEASKYDVRVFGNRIPSYKRSRGVFDQPIRLSSPAVAKVTEQIQDYNLSTSEMDIKGRAFQKMLDPAVRAGMGQYFTPDPVVSFMVEVATPSATDLIIDPFCGSGRFLSTCLHHVRESGHSSERIIHEFAFSKLHGIEKSERMVRIAMTDMRLQGDGHSNIRCTDSLLAFRNYSDIEPESFDLILTNPPFGSTLDSKAINELGGFELASSSGGTSLEVLGLERCYHLLRPGGKLAIVFPDGKLANRTTSHVRKWIEKKFKLRGIVSLPVETFMPFGANLNTSVLFVRKWREGEVAGDDYDIFLARADDVGYNSTMRDSGKNELFKVAHEFKRFLQEKGW